MKRNTWAYIVGFGGVVAFGSAHGCAFDPFSPPDYDDRPGATDVVSSSSGGAAGMGGAGGSGGVAGQGGTGGLAGQGGTAGAGGAVCLCDGVDDGNECTMDTVGACPDGDAAKCHTPDLTKVGQVCDPANNFICGAEGKCDRDCLVCTNEPWCTKRCNALACPDDSGCLSGSCEQGVCCNAECIGPCKSCNRAGTVGSCQRLPLGMQVTDTPACIGVQSCDVSGNCVTQMGARLGAGCNLSSDCLSGLCNGGCGCVSQAGEPCAEDLECGSNLCDKATHLCRPCTSAADCRAGANCVTGRCQAFAGEQADKSADCVAGTTYFRLMCTVDTNAMCTRHEECRSRNCKNGYCSNPCTKDADCIAGSCEAQWNQCKLPKGARCVPGSAQQGACQSGKCSGFPPRCE